MEEKTKGKLPKRPSFARISATISPSMRRGSWKKIWIGAFFFIAGMLVGPFIFGFANSGGSRAVREPGVLESNMDDDVSERTIPVLARKGHVPPSERPGLSIKKDMSIQFRDYVPRKIFINCGGTFPSSINLFRETYPDGDQYVIFTFLPDSSYSDLYTGIKNHTLFTPMFASNKNDTVQFNFNKLGGVSPSSGLVLTIDIAKWLIGHTRQDDYVIFKIDINDENYKQSEKDIAKRIVDLKGLEWIDKYYTTTLDKEILDFYNQTFSIHHMPYQIWDDTNGTFSDFATINPSRIPPNNGEICSKCKLKKEREKFALVLYADQSTAHVKQTILRLLHFAKERKLPVSLFLPLEFMKENHDKLHKLLRTFAVGLYVKTRVSTKFTTRDQYFNFFRNKIAAADRSFEPTGDYVLQHTLIVNDGNFSEHEKSLKRLVSERHVSVFQNARDMSFLGEIVAAGGKLTSGMLNLDQGQLLSVDLNNLNADTLAIYMIRRFEPWMFSIKKCLVQHKNA